MASSIWPRPLRTADSLIQKGRIHMLCIGLSPSIDKDCRALILGSMPGVKSLEEQQYYAHPQNRFWPMMADLLGEALPSRYEEKLAMLLDHHIALWDSIGQCEREGSLDSAIREERAMTSLRYCRRTRPSGPSSSTAASRPRPSGATTRRCSSVPTSPFTPCPRRARPTPAGACPCSKRRGEKL